MQCHGVTFDLTFDLVIVTMSFKILSGVIFFDSIRCRRWTLGRDIG